MRKEQCTVHTKKSVCGHATTLCFYRGEKWVVLMTVLLFRNYFRLGSDILLPLWRKRGWELWSKRGGRWCCVSSAALSAASGPSAAASDTPGLILRQPGGKILYSHTTSDVQTVICVLSHLIAGSSAKIQQSDVKQPHFLSASWDKSGGMDVLYIQNPLNRKKWEQGKYFNPGREDIFVSE